MKGYRSKGYIAAKKNGNWFSIMIEVNGEKRYYGLPLWKALEVITGRRGNAAIYGREK